MSNYPAGVSDATIDALYEDEHDEARRQETYAWLTRDPGWWRRYVKADRRARRVSLVEEHDLACDDCPPAMTADELFGFAEDLRGAEIRWERAMAVRGVRRARVAS